MAVDLWTETSLAARKLSDGEAGLIVTGQLMEDCFVSMDQVVEGLYLTGFYGVTESSVAKYQITHAVNLDGKCSNFNGLETFDLKITVSYNKFNCFGLIKKQFCVFRMDRQGLI